MPCVDYTNGIIYRIKNIYTDECYVGSSAETIDERFSKHKYCYKTHELNHKWVSSYYLFLKYGVENCYIELIKKFPCSSKKELEREEGFLTLQEPNRVNIKIAGRTRKEYYEDNTEIIKEKKQKYYEDNADKVKASSKKWSEDNADKVKSYKKNWSNVNADKVEASRQKYCENNAERVKASQLKYRLRKKQEKQDAKNALHAL